MPFYLHDAATAILASVLFHAYPSCTRPQLHGSSWLWVHCLTGAFFSLSCTMRPKKSGVSPKISTSFWNFVSNSAVLGIFECEKRCVVRAACVGQRSASGPGAVHAFHHLSRPPTAVEVRRWQGSRTAEHSLRPCHLWTAAKPRRTGQSSSHERQPAVSYSVRQCAGASRHCPSDVIRCPVYRRNLCRRY